MKHILLAITVTASLCGTSRAAFDPFTETPAEYNTRAQWLRDAKFGVFLHWNPSSLIGQEISWSRSSYGTAAYDALYQQFTATNFNADDWVTLFHNAGIRYAVCVPKHHDGFCMFDTATSAYNVMHSPFGRDYIKEISDACAKSDVRFCLYYSILDWWNPLYSSASGADLTQYKEQVFKPHMRELLTKYGPVGCIWFDGHWDASWTHANGREMYSYVRNLQPATLLGNRIDQKATADGPYCTWTGSFFNGAADPVGDYQAREVDLGKYYTGKAWDCCFSLCGVNSKWSWVPPMDPRPLSEVIGWLVQCIGRDGSMLLGVGPRADGTIDPASSARLLEVGDWMTSNGEAVYGSRGGPYLPGDWCVSTRKGNKVFVIVTQWHGNTVSLPALAANVTSSRLLTGGTGTFAAAGSTWTMTVPTADRSPLVTIVELTLDRDAMSLGTVTLPTLNVVSTGKPVVASGEWLGRETELSKSHVTDGNFSTIWAGPENSRSGWLEIDLGANHLIESVVLDEGGYVRCQAFEVQAFVAGVWQTVVSGSGIGANLQLGFVPILAQRFRLLISQANEVPTIAEFQLLERSTSSVLDGEFSNAAPGSDYSVGSNWDTSVVTGGCVIGSGGATRSALYNSATTITSSGALTLGTGAGSNGALTLSGNAGTLAYGSANVGSTGGAGALVVNAGTLTSAGDLTLATGGSGATGSVTVAGGTLSLTGSGRLIIADGAGANASVNLNSGSIAAASVVFAGGTGTDNTETGTFNLNGGTLTTGYVWRYNSQGTYTFNFNGGTIKPTAAQADFLRANNSYRVAGGGAVLDTGGYDITVARALAAAAGNGGLTKNGAGTMILSVNSSGSPMNLTANNGTLKLAVSGLVYTNPGGVGNGGTMTVNSGATLELSASYNLGYSQALVINGGTVNITSATTSDGAQYTENVRFTGGGTVMGHPMRLGDTVGNGGTMSVSGSAAAMIQTDIRMIGATGKSGTFDIGSTGGSGADLTVSGVISDYSVAGLPLIKTGIGTLRLTAANTYTGTTTVNAGTLLVNGSVASPVTVKANATLGGTGRANGAVNIQSGGTLAPGAGGTGTLATGNTTLAGSYACEIDGANCDQLAVTGNLVLTGAILSALTPGSSATAESYVIATCTGALTGVFSTTTGLPAGYSVSYDSTNKRVLVARNSYGTWLASYGLYGADALATADPDHDGIPNGIEFVLGSDPAVVTQDRMPAATVVGNNLIFTFRRTDASALATPVVQLSSSPESGAWSAVTTGIRVDNDYYGPGIDRVQATIPRPAAAKLFVRLAVTMP